MLRLVGIVLAAFVAAAGATFAQSTYPQRQVRIVVPFPAGGSTDIICRILGEKLSAAWGQPVVVENRAGAGGNIGAEAVYRAEPDGHTLLCSPPGPLSINHNLYAGLSFEPLRFVPITVLATIPNVITVRLNFTANSVAELIAHAKANPGKVFYASQGNGSTSHLSAELFASMTGTELVHVPYKGESPAMVDIIAGRVDIFIGNIAGAARFEQARQVRFLGLASRARSPIAPHVPAAPEFGLPYFIASAWVGLVAPPGTPEAIVQTISTATVAAVRLPDVQRKYLDLGTEIVAESPVATAAFIKSEEERWRAVIRTANVKLD